MSGYILPALACYAVGALLYLLILRQQQPRQRVVNTGKTDDEPENEISVSTSAKFRCHNRTNAASCQNDPLRCFTWPWQVLKRVWQHISWLAPTTQQEFWSMIVAVFTIVLAGGAIYTIHQVFSTMHVSERAYIGVGTGRIDEKTGKPKVADFMAWGGSVTIGLWVRNTGHTPARHFWVNSWDRIREPQKPTFLHMHPGNPVIEDKPKHTIFETIDIPADSVTEYPLTVRITPERMRDVIVGCTLSQLLTGCEPFLRVEGSYEFLDVFGEYCCDTYCVSWDQSQKTFVACSAYSEAGDCPNDYASYCGD